MAQPLTTAPANINQLLQAARAEASATTAGPLAQLAAQIAAQNTQTARATKAVAGDFRGLGNYVNSAGNQVGQIGQNLQGQLSGISSGLQGQLGNISSGEQGLVSQYTPKGDSDVSSAGQQGLVQALAQLQGTSAQNMAGIQAQGAEQQAGYGDLVQGLKGAFAKAGQQDLANIGAAGESAVAPLAEKMASTEGQKQALTEADLVKLRQQEITNNFDAGKLTDATNYHNGVLRNDAGKLQDQTNYHNAVVQLAGGKLTVAQQAANTTARNDAQKNGLAASKLNDQAAYQQGQLKLGQEKVTNAAVANQEHASYQQGLLGIDKQKASASQQTAQSLAAYRQAEINLKKGTGGTVPLTANENNRILNDLGEAVAAAKQLGKTQNPQTILSDLTSGNAQLSLQGGKFKTLSAMPRSTVQAALEYLHTGAISHQTYVQLHKMGVRGLPFKVAPPVK